MNSLQQVINEFIHQVLSINVMEKSLAESAEELLKETKAFCLAYLRSEIETLDQTLVSNPNLRPEWVVHKKVGRIQETILGPLAYTRRYYKHKTRDENAYLIDALIDVEKYERINQGLKAALCNQAVNHSYQMSAALSCENRVSKQSVMRIIQEANIPTLEFEASQEDVKVLHIQADEDHVAMQDGRRCKEVKLAVMHEMAYRVGKKGYLPNKIHQFSYREHSEDFWLRVAESIHQRYPNDQAMRIYLHGDGALWIKTGLDWLPGAKFVLDKFHVFKVLKQLAPVDSTEYLELKDSLMDADQAEFKRLVSVCTKLYARDEEQVKHIRRYILNNWSGISIWSQDPLCGISCAEGLVSHCLSERLSMRPMAWMDDGLEQMTKLREHHLNGGTIVWHDFKKSESEDQAVEKVKNSVKLESLYETYETIKAFDSLPVGQYHFPKRDARYRIFRAISEGGKAI